MTDTLTRWLNLPEKKWKGEPLCLFDNDKFFFEFDDVTDYCDENCINLDDLLLVICEPTFASEHTLDPYDHFNDSLAEDIDPPDELIEAVEAFNNALREYVKPLSWWSSGYRPTKESLSSKEDVKCP